MKKLIVLALLFTGCATFNHKITYWPNQEGIETADGSVITIVGNPRIACYQTIPNLQDLLIADGLFVRVNDFDHTLTVDEYGKDYVDVPNDNYHYCLLWKGN